METIKITGCSIACLYAEGGLDKCQCACGGKTHGLMAEQPLIVAAFCSRGQEKKCKDGTEGGECACACGGMNHGLYHGIVGFENVRITGYTNYDEGKN